LKARTAMSLVLYNTLTRKKEPFRPVEDGKVGMYVCGVTVYDKSHLGHAKSAINFDLIVRYLRYKGYDVNHVTNFTDVDDKIIKRADELSIDPLELSKRIIDDYFRSMDTLKVGRATAYPKATETMDDIIAMVQGLVEKDLAYESNGSVYFSVRKAKEYGKLSGQTLDQMVAGARIDPSEDKRDPMDFAVWKAAKPGEISWASPWGNGRPGWHIECSAMCLKHIGKTVDIHGGGTDLIFPHHENEILQSEAYTDTQFVRYWMHNGMLTIDEEKMSKSLKNFFLIDEVLSRYSPQVIRFFILNANYRHPLEYNSSSLDNSKRALETLQNSYDEIRAHAALADGKDDAEQICAEAWSGFESKMDDDFNSRDAIAVIYDFTRETNRLRSEGRLSRKGADSIVAVFDRFNGLFDVLVSESRLKMVNEGTLAVEEADIDRMLSQDHIPDGDVDMLVKARQDARKRKDFAIADKIRSALAEKGVDLQDTQEGAVWKRK
jgi:cysteinyl-tRNA synthetase